MNHAPAEDEIWTRRPGESAPAFRAFVLYRDLGAGRTVRKALAKQRQGQQGRFSAYIPGCWTGWSSRFQWTKRALAWDDHLAREADNAAVEARKKLQARHIVQLGHLFSRIVMRARSIDFSACSPGELVKLLLAVIEAERLVHGEPVSVQQVQHAGAPVRFEPKSFEPSAEFLAEVMGLLRENHALPAPEPQPVEETEAPTKLQFARAC